MSADGNWKITINTPMGAQEVSASITTSGDTFTGKTSGRMGDSEISGKVNGDTLTWSAAITQPMPMTLEFEATVSGDSMSGNVKLGAFGNAPLTGVRASLQLDWTPTRPPPATAGAFSFLPFPLRGKGGATCSG
jgi:hypothetical protein